MPTRKLYETAARWDAELAAVQGVIESETTTVRLVTEPGPLAAVALRTARAGLALHGARVEALVANRLLPTGSADPWLAGLSGQQQAALKELYESWGPDAVRELPHLGREPRLAQPETLTALAEAVGAPTPGPSAPPTSPGA
ncbi:ArsA-related P-loop ATPase [Streptomyces sp. M19]